MGKVRYKEPSKNFDKISSKRDVSNLRVSIGRDQSVGEYYLLSTDNLIAYEKQARRIFDEKEIEELSKTIIDNGIQSPLLIVSSKNEDGKFEVVSGERRLRAAKLLGLKKVPCIIIDDERAEEVALIENIQRSDLHPIELGDGIASLLEKANWGDVSKLAEKLGKDQSTISNYLSYSKLPDRIKDYLVSHNIRSRDVLRKLIKSSSFDEMEDILGIKSSGKKLITKSLLRINLSSDEFKIQDKSLYLLDRSKLLDVKKQLLNILDKIDKKLE